MSIFFFYLLGKFKSEAVLVDILEKGPGLLLLLDGNAFPVLIFIVRLIEFVCNIILHHRNH